MNLIKYKYELILIASFLFFLISYMYKQHNASLNEELLSKSQQEYIELIQTDKLEKIWSNKHTANKVNVLKSIVPSEKVKFTKKSKKLAASFKDLSAKELNKVLNKILNLSIQIEDIKIVRNDKKYNMELKCKW